jgi:hypothetical protein
VEIRRRIADFIAKIGKKKIECGSAFRTKKTTSFFLLYHVVGETL